MKIILTVISSLLLLNVSAQQHDALKRTAHPIMGKKLSINYVADSTSLSAAEQVSGRAYFYSKSKQTAEEKFSLEKKKGTWKGALNIPDSTILVSFVFNTPDGKVKDNNRNKGYLMPVYKKAEPAQFAYARMAELLGGGPPDAAGLKKDQKRALIFMKEEMRVHPESEVEFRSTFYNMLANSPEREDKVVLLKKLNELKSDREEELMMAQLYLSYFGGKKQADSLDKLLTMKFPNGNYVKNKALQAQRSANKTESEPHGTAQKTSVNKAEILKNVQDNLVDEPVNPLTLKDIDGNTVSIDAVAGNGKVTVIDFWATWCKPCIASFPAMQRVMEQYRNNPSVQFFFICTMEQGDAVKNAKAFMAKNPYPFKVLMDEKTEDMNMYKAYSAYKATGGIPYKLVIDSRGHARARTSGFSGNDQELITELSAMIDIALKSKK
ncbi:TlpA family protein disulfide reductase [Pedobacter hiemivivus]|uniref:TlpA family protein disulfide reductase n=1 Tax=Pedobacter hiemivivus TaxID=2530454 RepID=A0A4U1GIG5_9SPHI|nr:TlpA disulfide reductase family protein [Pedobacter hiemivivus]TKC64077.1 TlpA family protein disulfide reductase [Pedobacter hiemivivus]